MWTCVHVYVHTPTFIHRSHASRRNCQVRVRFTVVGHSRNVGPRHEACFVSQFWHLEFKRLSLYFHKICGLLQISVYTGCFTTLCHNCRRWFPRSWWGKKFI
jgi:hypothetical protein